MDVIAVVNMKYSYTVTDFLRTKQELKCAIGTQLGLLINGYKNGTNCINIEENMSSMQTLLFYMEMYNPNYFAPTSINCLTTDELNYLMQQADLLMKNCKCTNITLPVTIPDFYY